MLRIPESELWNCDRVSIGILTKSAHMDLFFQIETQISKNYSRKNRESQGLMGYKEFAKEDSDAVISQIRKIRDQMRVIRMKRLLAKEKDTLKSMVGEKADNGINKYMYR